MIRSFLICTDRRSVLTQWSVGIFEESPEGSLHANYQACFEYLKFHDLLVPIVA